jgi:hypothetical protein
MANKFVLRLPYIDSTDHALKQAKRVRVTKKNDELVPLNRKSTSEPSSVKK